MVNHSHSVYYSAISLLIKESTKSPLFVNYAPALGTQKRPPQAVFFGAPRALPPPAASRLPPRGRLGEDPQTPSHHRFPVALAISRLLTVVPVFSRPWGASTLPSLNPSPRGRGLGGRSRRSPAGSVASLPVTRRFGTRFLLAC